LDLIGEHWHIAFEIDGRDEIYTSPPFAAETFEQATRIGRAEFAALGAVREQEGDGSRWCKGAEIVGLWRCDGEWTESDEDDEDEDDE